MKKTKIKKDLFNRIKEIGSENKVRGITLISLVITIIILLILAGISIAQLTGNGLFEKAKLAKEVSKNAQEDEDDKIKQYGNEINSYVSGNRDYETEIAKLKEEIQLLKNTNSFSTSERQIGTWVNGKPLYQKTYNLTVNPSSQDVNIDNTINKNNTIPIETQGYIKISNGNYINAGYAGGVNFIIQENGFHCNTSGKYDITNIYVTIKYQKTSEQ